MHPRIRKIPPQPRHENPHLIHTPPQPPRHKRKAHRLAAPREVFAREPPDFLVLLVLGPRVARPLEGAPGDVGVAGGVHEIGEIMDDAEGEAHLVGGLVEVGVPLYDVRVWGDGAVIAVDVEVDVVELEVAAWLEVSTYSEPEILSQSA